MSDDRPSEVLGALSRTRPHRRSDKRAARPVGPPTGTEPTKAPAAPDIRLTNEPESRTRSTPRARPRSKVRRLPQPAQPDGTPAAPRARNPAPTGGPDLLGTAVQAAAELAEIGLSVSARALRRAVSRLPRP